MSREVLIANPPQECRGVTNFRSPPLIYPVQPFIAVYTDGSLNISCGYLNSDTGNCGAEKNLVYRKRCPYLSATIVRRIDAGTIRLEYLGRLEKEPVLEVVYNLPVGRLIINPEQHWIVQSPGWPEGKKGPVPLTATEYRLLNVLLRNRGQVMEIKTLKSYTFRRNELYYDDECVRLYVYYLRRKLGPLKKEEIITCKRGEGYSIPIANDEALA